MSIEKIFEKINLSDKSFLKYIPDGFLNDLQKQAKQEEINASQTGDSGGRAALADGTKATSGDKGEILGGAVEALTKYTLFVIDKP